MLSGLPRFHRIDRPIAPAMLDELLAQGWYRMRQHIFTTDELDFEDGSSVPVSWLRVKLNDYSLPNRYGRLARRCRKFSCTLQPWHSSREATALYALYRTGIDFDPGPSIASVLLEGADGMNFFPTKMWELRDGERLIGVSYFDEGRQSAAGILTFYDPAYHACSPGLWLYLQSVRHCAESGKEFFYPGYVALGWTKFDYKLLAGTTSIEAWESAKGLWRPYAGSVHQTWTALGSEGTATKQHL